MRRRDFVAGLGCAAAAWPVAAREERRRRPGVAVGFFDRRIQLYMIGSIRARERFFAVRTSAPDKCYAPTVQADCLKGTSKNSPYRLLTTKLPPNDSALFPFRFVHVHASKVRDWH